MSVRRFPPPFLHATQENSYLSTLPIMLDERIQKKERKKKDKKRWKPSDVHNIVLHPCDDIAFTIWASPIFKIFFKDL